MKLFVSNFKTFVATLLFSVAFCFCFYGNVFALSFNTADYPGWCATNVNNQSGDLTVDFVCCGDDPTGGIYYSNNTLLSIDINYPTTCTCVYNYGNWGTCTSGFKSRTVTSQSPSGATCTNAPVTTQSCDSVDPTVTISVPINNSIITTGSQPITFGYDDNVAVTSIKIYDGSTQLASLSIATSPSSSNYNWNTSTASEGSHTLTVYAYDAAGNDGSDYRTVLVDKNEPNITLTAPSANGIPITIGSIYNLSASASDAGTGISKVEFFLDSTATSLGLPITTSPYSFAWNTTGVSAGTHTIIAKATDGANRIRQASFTVSMSNPTVVDTTDPTIYFTSPIANGTPVDNTFTISTNAYDAESGISKVEFFLDTLGNPLGSSITAIPYGYAWNTTNADVGTHTLIARATNGVNMTKQVSVTVLVLDSIDPTVDIIAPAASAIVDGTVTIRATVDDNVAVSYVRFYIDGVEKYAIPGSTATTYYSYSWITNPATVADAVSDGDHTIIVKAFDAAATPNIGTDLVTVNVHNATASAGGGGGDNTPPGVEITYPKDGATVNDTVTVVVTASDSGGVSQIKFYVDGDYKDSDALLPYSFTWKTAGLANREYKLSAKAFDEAGNSKSVEIKVNVDNANDDVAPVTCDFSCKKWNDCAVGGK